MRSESINEAFLWQRSTSLSQPQSARPLYKQDPFLFQLEELITKRKAWAPITGTTCRTEKAADLLKWINTQNATRQSFDRRLGPHIPATLQLTDFPQYGGNPDKRILSSSARIVYLVDDYTSFLTACDRSFGIELHDKAARLLADLPVFVYVSNSIESGGRAFKGDPFTGQLAAYSRIFAYDLLGQRVMNFVAYYPHQLYSQFFTANGRAPDSKGVKVLRSQATLIITCGGVPIYPYEWSVIE